MKKTIITVFSVIAVLIIAGILVNIATGGSFWHTVGAAVAEPINKGWHAVAGKSANDLIDVGKILDDAGVQEGKKNDIDSVFAGGSN